jgi:hypothetical protein
MKVRAYASHHQNRFLQQRGKGGGGRVAVQKSNLAQYLLQAHSALVQKIGKYVTQISDKTLTHFFSILLNSLKVNTKEYMLHR